MICEVDGVILILDFFVGVEIIEDIFGEVYFDVGGVFLGDRCYEEVRVIEVLVFKVECVGVVGV